MYMFLGKYSMSFIFICEWNILWVVDSFIRLAPNLSKNALPKYAWKVYISRTTDRTAISVILRDRRVDGIVFVAVWINIEADLLSNNPAALVERKR